MPAGPVRGPAISQPNRRVDRPPPGPSLRSWHWLASERAATDCGQPAPSTDLPGSVGNYVSCPHNEEYLAAERAQTDIKHECVNGEVFAMTGASFNHNLIVVNPVSELRSQLKNGRCRVLPSDMRVCIEAANARKYPDPVALCEEPRFHDQRHDVLLNPSLIVEVLSQSTEAYERGAKFAIYRRLPSLQEYAIVSQDRPLAEVYGKVDFALAGKDA